MGKTKEKDKAEQEQESKNLPATQSDTEEIEGLEDFDTIGDAVMPRIGIAHKEAKFVDNLSNEQFTQLDVILLGLVKQRILWAPDVEDDAKPLCKSFDHDNGHPDVAGKPQDFPWRQSGFDFKAWEPGTTLPCAGCALKEWGSGRNDAPWCSEQFTIPVVYKVNEDTWAPALMTFQRSSIKPARSYLTAFVRNRTPLYVAVTRLTLTAQKRGNVDYAVPVFTRVGDTEEEQWPYYAQQYRSVRDYITRPPRRDDDEGETDANVHPATTSSDEAEADDDDDVPF